MGRSVGVEDVAGRVNTQTRLIQTKGSCWGLLGGKVRWGCLPCRACGY